MEASELSQLVGKQSNRPLSYRIQSAAMCRKWTFDKFSCMKHSLIIDCKGDQLLLLMVKAEERKTQRKTKISAKKDKLPQLHQTKKLPKKVKAQPQSDAAPVVIAAIHSAKEIGPIFTGGRIQVSQDSSVVASVCHGSVAITETDSFACVYTVTHPDEEIFNFVLHPDSSRLFTFTVGHLLRLVQFQGQVLKACKLEKHYPLDMAVDPAAKVLVLGCSNSWLKVLSASGLQVLSSHKAANSIKKVVVDRRLVAYYLDDDGIKAFDIQLNAVVFAIKERGLPTFNFADDRIFVQRDGLASVYEGGTLKLKSKMPLEDCSSIQSCGSRVYFGGKGLFELDGQAARQLPGYSDVYRLLALEKKGLLLLVTNQQVLQFLRPQRESLATVRTIAGYNDQITDCKFMQNSQLALVSTNSAAIKLYDLQSNELRLLEWHSDIVLALDTSGWWAVSGGKDKTAKVWRVKGLDEVEQYADLRGHSEDVTTVALSYNGQLVATGSADKTIKLWDLSSKKSISTTYAHEKSINRVVFSKDCKQLMSCSHDRTIRVHALPGMEVVLKLAEKAPVWEAVYSGRNILAVTAACGVLYSPEGERLAVWGNGGYRVVGYRGGWWVASEGRILGYNFKAVEVCEKVVEQGARIWGFDKQGGRFLAGVDGKLIVYEDCTEAEKTAAQKVVEQEERDYEDYNRLMNEGQYKEAALMAFRRGYTHSFVRALEKLRFPALTEKLSFSEGRIEIEPYDQQAGLEVVTQLARDMLAVSEADFLKLVKSVFQSSRFQQVCDLLLGAYVRLVSLEKAAKAGGSEWWGELEGLLLARRAKLGRNEVESYYETV